MTHGNASFTLILTKIVACDNMYTMESKDELVFVDFFVHPIPFIVYN
jgi:hypothetical protein